MLQELAGSQKAHGENLAGETQALANRIVDLEARLQTLEAGGGRPAWATALEDAGNGKPALIIGGMGPRADETLTKAHDIIGEFQLDIDAEESFKETCDGALRECQPTRNGVLHGHCMVQRWPDLLGDSPEAGGGCS